MPSFLTRAMARALSLALLLAALSLAGAAHAATDTYNGGAVAGCSYNGATSTYSCSALSTTNDITITSGHTVVVNGAVDIGATRTLTMDGSATLQVTGDLKLATSKLNLSGGNLSVGGGLTLIIGAATPTVDISAATIAIQNSTNAVLHGTLTAAGALAFQSSMRVTGLVTAGDTTVDKNFDVVANLRTGTLNVALQASLTGNVNASGNVDLANHAAVYGDLTGHDVVLENACAYISGDAAVNSIVLGAQGSVGKTITCTGAGAHGSSCVTGKSNGNGNACHHGGGVVVNLDHILISHTGSALTCEPQTVTVTACADAACSTYYTDPVDVTLSPGGQTLTVTGGVNDSATVQQTTAGNATLSASAAEAANASTCYNTVTNSASCTMLFADAGFSFAIPDHRAEQSQTFSLRALKAGSGANVCVPLLANVTHNINFICNYNNPASGFVPVRVSGTNNVSVPLAADTNSSCSSGGAVVGLLFDASGTASAKLQYADAGRMTLNATLIPPSGPYAGLVLTGASNFIAAPASFRFTITNGSTPNPAASDDTGPVFIGAGQPFKARLEAINTATPVAAVTRNFGRESPPESYTLAQSLVAPAGGHMVAVGGSLAAMQNGATPDATMSWDEVGIINFAAALVNANGYLNSGLGVTGTVNIGRFIPDHFDTALSGTVPMACPLNPAFGTPCPAPNAGGKFIYAAQPFDLSVKAYNKTDAITQNYEGLYAKAITLAAYNGVGASGAANQNPPAPPIAPAGNNLSPAAIDASHFAKGVATAGPGSLPAYLFANGYPAMAALLAPPTNIWLRATDTDGATSLRGAATSEALVSVVSGRLSVGNSYGSEALPMPVVVQAQFWSGTGGWVNNPAYANATPVTLSKPVKLVTFSNCQKNLANSGTNTCALTFTLLNQYLSFTGGSGKFTVAAPGRSGAVDITLMSDTSVPAIPYLPSTTGRATFGVYRAGPVVYLREVY